MTKSYHILLKFGARARLAPRGRPFSSPNAPWLAHAPVSRGRDPWPHFYRTEASVFDLGRRHKGANRRAPDEKHNITCVYSRGEVFLLSVPPCEPRYSL